jgi:hypothetical protein
VAKVVARLRAKMTYLPIVAGDQGSRQCHQCGETSLTGEPGSIVILGAQDANHCYPRRVAND